MRNHYKATFKYTFTPFRKPGTTQVDQQKFSACLVLQSDNHLCGAKKGEQIATSEIKSIDFVNGVLVTQNSIYELVP